jgi:CRISPR-associated protein Csx17
MKPQRLPGITPSTLANYLCGLGLIHAIARCTDPDVRAAWSPGGLSVTTEIDDLAAWLDSEFLPAPIVSPWNGGSGFGPKDKKSKDVLDQILAVPAARLVPLNRAIRIAHVVAQDQRQHGWVKQRTVQELRNRCPEELLGWLDAAIILQQQGAQFPPLLGTGGNDGRLDFSTNYHQRLVDVLPELGASAEESHGWADDLLYGTAKTKLGRGSIGQFDPAAAGGPNSSPFGAASTQLNPWQYVLLLEGATYFASGLARRLGTNQSRAAMPFTVYASPDGPTPGTSEEVSRGEIWCPLWRRPLAAPEIAQLFSESRASWQGQQATQASQMYAAARSYGVARGIDQFLRFGLHRRNGLAFSAVLLDTVGVHEDSEIKLLAEPEQIMAPYGRLSSAPIVRARRRFDRELLLYARDPRQADHLQNMLAEQTLADLGVLRSANAREGLSRRRPLPKAVEYIDHLHRQSKNPAALRIGASLASVAIISQADTRHKFWQLRDVIIGQTPVRTGQTWEAPPISSFSRARFVSTLAEVVRWRAHHVANPVHAGVVKGFLPTDRGIRAPWQDVHAWVMGLLDDDEVFGAFLACLALDWYGVKRGHFGTPPAAAVAPAPDLAILQLFSARSVKPADAAGGSTGTDPNDVLTDGGATAKSDQPRSGIHGLLSYWPSQLLSGRPDRVLDEATAILTRHGWSAATPRPSTDADRLLAALLINNSGTPAHLLGVRPPHDRQAELSAIALDYQQHPALTA